MELRFFEDIRPGDTAQGGPIEVTRDAIFAFARVYDPQPFHLDEAAASASLLGGLAASGWHTAAIGMRLFFDGFLRHVASMGAPGVDDLRWVRPVRPGDLLSLFLTVEDTRLSASKPDRGFVRMIFELRNGAGQCVMTQRFSAIVRRRGTTERGRSLPAPAVSLKTEDEPPADPMLAAPFDEAVIGPEIALGRQIFASETITTFAAAFDPQYFHLDAKRAEESHFGGLVASGWQTAAFWMKHYVDARSRSAEARRAAGLPVATGGPSPGFTDLKWLQPVRTGAAVTYALKILDKQPTKRAEWGIITTENTGRLADGTLVFSFLGRVMWPLPPRR